MDENNNYFDPNRENRDDPAENHENSNQMNSQDPYNWNRQQYQNYQRPDPNQQYQNPYNAPQPPQQEPPRKKNGGTIVLVAIVCALIGSLLGGILVGAIVTRNVSRLPASTEQSTVGTKPETEPASTAGTTQQTEKPTEKPAAEHRTGMTPAEVYEENVNCVVGVLNTSTTTYGYNIFGQTSQTTSSGTGFIITNDGEIITNYHVIEGANTLTVTTYDGQEYAASVLGYDKYNDIALIKIDAENLPCATLGDSDALKVGDQIAAIGNPLGELTYSMTVGYVSSMSREVNTDGNATNMLQIDAAINAGNSGGPLFDMNGNVVGVTSAKYSGTTSSGASIEGIGFAIPINDVVKILDELRSNGAVTNRAYIGISASTVNKTTADLYGLREGALVSSVEPEGAGERAGLQKSDIITAIDGKKITSSDELVIALRNYRAGDSAVLTVFRNGAEIEVPITFDAKPTETAEAEPTQQTRPSSGFGGFGFGFGGTEEPTEETSSGGFSGWNPFG